MKHRARQLRRQQTDAERHLWYYLRDRRLRGYKFRRQHLIDRYIVDFACLEVGLIVELDGGQHAEETRAYDSARTKTLESCGFCVLRFWNDQVFKETDAVLEGILRYLESCTPSQSRTPSP